jgi:sodium/bile acid cotransporter 7
LAYFTAEDEIAIVFCGSKKSMASSISMATILFPAHAVSLIVFPLMLFYQAQLFVCATLARRYAQRGQGDAAISKSPSVADYVKTRFGAKGSTSTAPDVVKFRA